MRFSAENSIALNLAVLIAFKWMVEGSLLEALLPIILFLFQRNHPIFLFGIRSNFLPETRIKLVGYVDSGIIKWNPLRNVLTIEIEPVVRNVSIN